MTIASMTIGSMTIDLMTIDSAASDRQRCTQESGHRSVLNSPYSLAAPSSLKLYEPRCESATLERRICESWQRRIQSF
jgi:hypothetical protein